MVGRFFYFGLGRAEGLMVSRGLNKFNSIYPHQTRLDRSSNLNILKINCLTNSPQRIKLMQTANIKEKAQKLLDNLPDLATWEDLMYRIYVREAIEAGIKDSDQGRTVDVKEVRRRFGLSV